MVRLVPALLLALACGLALAAWAPQASAGTPDKPEITDPAGDQEVTLAGQPECVQGTCELSSGTDLLAGWIALESATAIHFYFSTTSACPGTVNTYLYSVNFQVAGKSYVASATCNNLVEGENTPVGNGALAPGDVATAATLNGTVMDLTVPKSAIGDPAAGTALTGFFITAQGTLSTTGVPFTDDRAPDSGNGQDYTFTGGAAAGGNATDKDGDGLNDTWETQHFTNTTAQNGTGDPDHDGLNNTAEQAAGTNATKADTDGDGLNDKQDPFPLDPSKPGAAGNGTGNGTGKATAGDRDGDGLNDTWEKRYFNSTAAQKGSGDPDRDGLNNTAEQKLGTDPSKADTDGDGLDDAVDPHPLSKAAKKEDRLELHAGAGMFAAAGTLCLFALARRP